MTPTPAPTTKLKSTSYPTINPTPQPTYFIPVSSPIQPQSYSKKEASPRAPGQRNHIIAAIVVGACCVSFFGFLYLKMFSDTKKMMKEEKESNPPPLQITFSNEDNDSISYIGR